jgi:hypothetical protein
MTDSPTPDRKPKQRQAFYHEWIMGECYLLIHRSTGLKVFCEPKDPPPDDPLDNWHAYTIDVHAAHECLAAQAAQDGTSAEQYIEQLARGALELINQFMKDEKQT